MNLEQIIESLDNDGATALIKLLSNLIVLRNRVEAAKLGLARAEQEMKETQDLLVSKVKELFPIANTLK